MQSLVYSHLQVISLVNHELATSQETKSEDNELLKRITSVVLEDRSY